MKSTPTIAVWCLRTSALATLTLAATAVLCPLAGASSVTVSAVIRAAQRDIAGQTSVHVDFVAHSSSPSRTEKIVDDLGVASGKETATDGKAHVDLTFSAGAVYVSGNSAGLTTLFGMTSAEAKKVGQKWVSWKAGSGQYANLKVDLTMSSVLALLPKAKGTRVSVKDSKFSLLKWTVPATTSTPALSNTLTLSNGAMTLPVTEYATTAGGTRVTTTLSNWGENVLVNAPPTASVISSSKVGS
jgi:hypothetical protein